MAKRSTKPAKTDRKLASERPVERAIDRPFDPAILKRARALAQRYRIVLEQSADNGVEYFGSTLELPGALGDGKTADACVKSVRESAVALVAYLIETGEAPPVPADEQIRNKQVNIRLTETEQARLKEAAAASGFTDLSDFIRTTSLRKQSA